jgi:hypothetical protein
MYSNISLSLRQQRTKKTYLDSKRHSSTPKKGRVHSEEMDDMGFDRELLASIADQDI